MSSELDPVTTEVIGNALMSVAEEMGIVLVQSAFSPNIKERKDCSTALFDPRGQLIVQAEHIPVHLGSLLGVVEKVLAYYHGSIYPGDVFIANDPYQGGGTHLPDVTLVSPCFYEDRLVGFIANIAHHSDFGGRVPGSIAGDSESIYEEGLRLPPTRLLRRGEMNEEILNIILLNCRLPEQRMLDLQGQIAANHAGQKRLEQLFAKKGTAVMFTAYEHLLNYSENRLRQLLKEIPDGSYTYEDLLDDDGCGTSDIKIKAALNLKGDSLLVDFTGSSPQARGAVNVVHTALAATVYYSVKAALDPEIPVNAGLQRVIQFQAPPGTILNPTPPASVAARTDTCQRTAGVLLGAFARAFPSRAAAGSHDASTSVVFSGWDPQRQRDFIYVEAVGGGGGARSCKDGLDGIQVHVTNTSNLPVEVLENEFPLLVQKYALRPHSGGKGRFKGGRGLIREIKVLAPEVFFSSHADRQVYPPRGIHGGENGKPGSFLLNPDRPEAGKLPSKTSGVRLVAGDVLRIETPGGGGYGSP